jgi:hypothetical protein
MVIGGFSFPRQLAPEIVMRKFPRFFLAIIGALLFDCVFSWIIIETQMANESVGTDETTEGFGSLIDIPFPVPETQEVCTFPSRESFSKALNGLKSEK